MTRRASLGGLLTALALAIASPARAEPPAAVTIEFLEGDAAKAAIADDAAEPYFSLLQPLEMSAKMKQPVEGADLAAQREDCRRHYRDGVVPLTAEEKDGVRTVIGRLHAAWAATYPVLAKTPWSILPVSDAVEAGLPHSRGRHIVLPQAVLHDLVRVAKDPKDEVVLDLLALLAHEQAHVLQRRDPEAFAALYASWGFVHAKEVASHPWLDRYRATNPDGPDVRWVFPLKEGEKTTWIQPLALFAEGDAPSMPADLRAVAVTLEKKGDAFVPVVEGEKPVVRDLPSLAAYQDLWGGIGESFHPNEIFAVLFARMIVKDHVPGVDVDVSSPAAGKDSATLRAWCRERFGANAPR